MTTTSGSAKWQGGIKDGKGAISTKSGALKDYPYGFASRFEGKPGSNPEELIGAIGVSGGSGSQDQTVATAGVAAFANCDALQSAVTKPSDQNPRRDER